MIKWISTKDRLPMGNTTVLVTSGDGTVVETAQWFMSTKGVRWQYGGSHHDFLPEHRTPTHWMPLPKPPKS